MRDHALMRKTLESSSALAIRKVACGFMAAAFLGLGPQWVRAQAMCSGELSAAIGGCKEAALVASGVEAFSLVARAFGRLGPAVEVDVDFDGGRYSGQLSGEALSGRAVSAGDLVKLDCSGPTAMPRQGRLCELSYSRKVSVAGKPVSQHPIKVQVASSGEPDPAVLILAPPKGRGKPSALASKSAAHAQ